jgi:hypothetical protein
LSLSRHDHEWLPNSYRSLILNDGGVIWILWTAN